MITTSISIFHNNGARLVLGPTVEDASTIANILKTNYNSVELANALLDGGDISQLGDTIDTTTYTGVATRVFDTLDIAETQIIPSEVNFVYLTDGWTQRSSVEDGYRAI